MVGKDNETDRADGEVAHTRRKREEDTAYSGKTDDRECRGLRRLKRTDGERDGKRVCETDETVDDEDTVQGDVETEYLEDGVVFDNRDEPCDTCDSVCRKEVTRLLAVERGKRRFETIELA